MSNNFFNDTALRQANNSITRKFITAVYGWMVAALAMSGIASLWVLQSRTMLSLIFGNRFGFLALCIVEVVLVSVLMTRIRTMSFTVALGVFVAYSVLNGITLSSIFLVYASTSVVRIFIIAALMFGAMSVYGMTTKSDLRSAGRYLMMAVIGIVIASFVNMLFRSSSLDWLISFASVGVFTGLTAYDSQKIVQMSTYAQENEQYKKMALIGALELYLDFVNLFISLLRLFGRRR